IQKELLAQSEITVPPTGVGGSHRDSVRQCAGYRGHPSTSRMSAMSTHSTGLGDDEPLVVSPRRARRMLDCGNTRLYELLGAGHLQSFKDGKSRKITVASIKAYVAEKLD